MDELKKEKMFQDLIFVGGCGEEVVTIEDLYELYLADDCYYTAHGEEHISFIKWIAEHVNEGKLYQEN